MYVEIVNESVIVV